MSIDKENKIYLGQIVVPESALDSVLKVEVEKVRNFIDTPSVVINADTISFTGSFFKIMSSAKKAGAKVVANVKN